MTKRKRTREKKRKAQSPEQLVTPDQMSIARRFAGTYDKAWLLIDHPHSYRQWNIVGRCDVPGFFYLESRFRLTLESSRRSTRHSSSVFTRANLRGSHPSD